MLASPQDAESDSVFPTIALVHSRTMRYQEDLSKTRPSERVQSQEDAVDSLYWCERRRDAFIVDSF